jgi:hypothetical protein
MAHKKDVYFVQASSFWQLRDERKVVAMIKATPPHFREAIKHSPCAIWSGYFTMALPLFPAMLPPTVPGK